MRNDWWEGEPRQDPLGEVVHDGARRNTPRKAPKLTVQVLQWVH